MSAPRGMLSGAEAAAIERGELDLSDALAAHGIQRQRPPFTGAAGPEFAPVRLRTVTVSPGSDFGRAAEARLLPRRRRRLAEGALALLGLLLALADERRRGRRGVWR